MIGWLKRRIIYREAWDDYREGFAHGAAGRTRNPAKLDGGILNADRRFRIAYDAGHEAGRWERDHAPGIAAHELPTDVWVRVLAEGMRP